MENSRIPVILRDAQVLPIWEGTTNILSLDFVNDIFKNFKLNIEIIRKLLGTASFNPNVTTSRLDSELTQKFVDSLTSFSTQFVECLISLSKTQNIDLI